jgi:uncharacterized membrane protein YphA (DoxX/SURF4 family)
MAAFLMGGDALASAESFRPQLSRGWETKALQTDERSLVDAMTLSWWAGLLELIFGTLITLGLFTRVAA